MKRMGIIILLIIMMISIGNTFVFADEMMVGGDIENNSVIEKAKILDVEVLDDVALEDIFFEESFLVTLEILTGTYKGQQFQSIHNLTGNLGYDIYVNPGDKVLVTIEESEEGTVEVFISEYLRDTYVYWVFILFIALLILLGGIKGIKTIITLALTILLVIKGLLPGLLAGYSPILLTILISIIITLVTIIVVGGWNTKSFAAIIGVLGGVFVAGIIAYIIGSKVRLTGMSSDEAMMLMYIPQGIRFDYRGLLFAGIIMGALGAVMDVGMSIASSMEEISNVNPNISTKELIISGLNVGRDIMGTMANTLILAYTGSAIPLLLLFTAYQDSFIKIINLDIIATEIIRAFSGSIGLILSIPLTAVTAGLLKSKLGNRKNNKIDL